MAAAVASTVPASVELTEEQKAEANKFKELGNKAFAAKQFQDSVNHFTSAIAIDPTNEVFYSNRAAAYINLGKSDRKYYALAEEDGKKCVDLKPDWGKGYTRYGQALLLQAKYTEAAKVYATGISKEPTNTLLAEGLSEAQRHLKMQKEAEEDEKEDVIGIDLGTTFSAVGVWRGDGVVMVPNDRGEFTTPSWVAFTNTGKRLVGQPARSQVAMNPHNTIHDVKRFIGQRWTDPGVQTDCGHYAFKVAPDGSGKPLIEVDMGMHGKKKFAAEEISAMVLANLKKSAEAFLKRPVNKAVITVPAYFSDSQRAATKAAGRIAGLEVLRIINEPTAAALAYGLDLKARHKKKVNVLIFDCGGGTFDVSLLAIEGGVFEVVSTGGDTRLGGEDFDIATVQHILKEAQDMGFGDLSKDARALKRIQSAVEAAKRTLSTAQVADIHIEALVEEKKGHKKESKDFNYQLDRAKFEKLCEPYFLRCLDTVKKVLRDGKTKMDEVDDIVLVGGSTRIPKIQQMLSEAFGGKELCRSVHPDEAVAYGAAVQGAILSGRRIGATKDLLLMDVTPLSLGIETEGRVMSVIIPRNTRIPVVKTQTYTTTTDYQTEVEVAVYEGERMKSDANNLLGEFHITGIERAKRGEAKVEVTFAIDSNGILNVTAHDSKTNATAGITIASRSRTSDEDVERMIRDAEAFRREDEARAKQVEACNELEHLIHQVEELLLSDPSLGEELERQCNETAEWLHEHKDRSSAADVVSRRKALSATLAKAERAAADGGAGRGRRARRGGRR